MQRSDLPEGPAQQRLGPSKHRSGPSVATAASGIADSTISFNSVATGESLRLGRFPAPPSEIPTPQQSPASTPTRSLFSVSTRGRSTRLAKRNNFLNSVRSRIYSPADPTSRSAPTSPPATPSETRSFLSIQDLASTNFPRERHDAASPPSTSFRDYHHSFSSNAIPLTGSPIASTSNSNMIRTPFPSYLDSRQGPSTFDWHEGYSTILVDTFEDRMLSTSFITSLLASSTNIEEDDPPPTPQARTDAASVTSTITYPLIATVAQTPDHSFATTSARTSVPPVPPVPPQPARSRPSDETAVLPYSPTHKRLSGDSATLYSLSDHPQGSIIETASVLKLPSRRPTLLACPPANQRQTVKDNGTQNSISPTIIANAVLQIQTEKTQDTSLRPPAPFMEGESPNFTYLRPPRIQAQSIRTQRSGTSLVSSLISRVSLPPLPHVQGLTSWLRKPLPPVPRTSYAAGTQLREDEVNMPLNDLANRAGAVESYLNKGLLPHMSVDGKNLSRRDLKPIRHESTSLPTLLNPGIEKRKRRFRRIYLTVTLCILAFLSLAVGLPVALTNRNHRPICSGNYTGASCDLDATCVCTSSTNGQCTRLAQGLTSLIPSLNTFFLANYTSSSLASSMWQAQGAPVGVNCNSQVNVVDVPSSLHASPNRTLWVRTALLWDFLESQDTASFAKMQSFVAKAPWKKLQGDGPTTEGGSTFQISVSGFIFDFAAQTVTQPNFSFISDGQPNKDQASRVGSGMLHALDRMYTFAAASSTQRQQAWNLYWQTVLLQKAEDMPAFMSVIASSPVVIPFDATANAGPFPISELLNNSTDQPFPPPASCYPGLSSGQIQRLNSIETSLFGLPPASTATNFDPTCYPNRPLYGNLDILRLRLPFPDSETGVAKQAVVLKNVVSPRVVLLRKSMGLSNLTSTTNPLQTTLYETDPRHLATLNHLNHIILDYLSSIPDVNVAIALVKYILTSPALPPTNSNTLLFNSLQSLPPLEVAVFGSVTSADIDSSQSSFSSPDGSLFFGSDQALAFREWALNAVQVPILWANSTTSPLVVHDRDFSNAAFASVWNPAFIYLHTHPAGVNVDVSNVTAGFQSTGQLTP